MRWPTRALVLVGLRFEDADAERRFAHSLRTKQLISFIICRLRLAIAVVMSHQREDVNVQRVLILRQRVP